MKYGTLLSISQKILEHLNINYIFILLLLVYLFQTHLVSQRLECGNLADKKATLISMWVPITCSTYSSQGAY